MLTDFNFYSEIVLEDEKVKLEPLASRHFDELLSITLKNPDLLKFSPSPFGTDHSLQEYFQKALGQRISRRRYPFAIFDKMKGIYVGSTSLGNYSSNHKQIEIGWTWIGKEYHRTGINRHSKYLLLKYAFETIKCNRVEFRTDERNLQSQKAIQSIGGRYEGELKTIVTMPDGHLRKSLYYSIIKEEWNYIKENNFTKQEIV